MNPDTALYRTVVHPESTVTVVWIPAHVYEGHFIPGRLRIRVGHVELHGLGYESAEALVKAIGAESPSELARKLEDSLQAAVERGQARRALETIPASEPPVEGTRTVADPPARLALVVAGSGLASHDEGQS